MSSIPRLHAFAYVVAAVLLLALAARWLSASSSGDAAARSTTASASPAAPPALEHTTSRVTVHVAGAVRRPGVYRLTDGSRVQDAVRRAGGASRQANSGGVNLAAKLVDGQQVIVPSRVHAAAGPAASSDAAGPVSLNTASLAELDALDGVGPSIAQKIVDWRTQHGGFAAVDDLDQIAGIGPKKLEALRSQVVP